MPPVGARNDMTSSFTVGTRIEKLACGDVHYEARFNGYFITFYAFEPLGDGGGRRRHLLARVCNHAAGWAVIERLIADEAERQRQREMKRYRPSVEHDAAKRTD